MAWRAKVPPRLSLQWLRSCCGTGLIPVWELPHAIGSAKKKSLQLFKKQNKQQFLSFSTFLSVFMYLYYVQLEWCSPNDNYFLIVEFWMIWMFLHCYNIFITGIALFIKITRHYLFFLKGNIVQMLYS